MKSEIKTLNLDATHIVFISDIHFGVRVNNEEWQENLANYFYNYFIPNIRRIKSTLKDGERLICVNLGDTYQDRKAIDINVENLAIDVFQAIAQEVEVVIINGNHDLAKKTNKGATSLRSLDLIPNVRVITDPTMIDIHYGEKTSHMKFLAIPYLGDNTLETKYLADYSASAKYALMHTELTNMKMANGTTITNGANTEIFKGRVLSGHIHKRQETKDCIYVGTPYHLDKADVGDVKGLYLLDIAKNELTFLVNDYSPKYQVIQMDKYVLMSEQERTEYLNNNYTEIYVDEDKVVEYKKKFDLQNMGLGTTAKMVKVVENHKKRNNDDDEQIECKELSIGELLALSITESDYDEETKTRLLDKSNKYLSDAELDVAI